MPLLIAALLGISALFVVIYPLLGLERAPADAGGSGALSELAERERAAKDALRDVEFDRQLGNLEDADYRALRARYERRAITALGARYRREQELDALIERQLAELRAREEAATAASASPPSAVENCGGRESDQPAGDDEQSTSQSMTQPSQSNRTTARRVTRRRRR